MFFHLMLLVVAVVTGVSAFKPIKPLPLTLKGGYFLKENVYIMIENRTMEVELLIKAEDVHVKWFCGGDLVENVTTTRVSQDGKGSYIYTSTAAIKAQRQMEPITWAVYSGFLHLTEYHNFNFKYYVFYPIAPKIKIVDGAHHLNKSDNGTYYIGENERFSLQCEGGGMDNFTLAWLDSSGHPIVTNSFVQLGELEQRRQINYLPIGNQILNVTAKRRMKSFGCVMEDPYTKTPLFTWFNVTVTYLPNVTLTADNTVCGEVSFTCIAVDDIPEKVEYRWIMNGVDRMRKQNLTVKLDRAELTSVECLATNEFGSSSAFLNATDVDFANCYSLKHFPVWLMIIVVTSGAVILAGVFYATKLYLARRPSHYAHVYKVLTNDGGKDSIHQYSTKEGQTIC